MKLTIITKNADNASSPSLRGFYSRTRSLSILWAACLLFMLVTPCAYAAPTKFFIDTSTFAGTTAQLVFDLVDGGSPTNSVTISGFSTDGELASSSSTGSVTGTLSGTVEISDATFLSEYAQDLILGTTITFLLNDTGRGPDPESFPDGLTVYLLDAISGLPLVSTSDPVGADALFLLAIGSLDGAMIYDGEGFSVRTSSATTIPEPSVLMLLSLSCASILLCLQLSSSPSGASRLNRRK